jgi:biotin carboxyl carrier protein
MPEDDLLPVGLPMRVPPLRKRTRRRQGFLVAGLTGLVVTAPGPASDSPLPLPAPVEAFADEAPDPAPLFGRELARGTMVGHERLVSALSEGRSGVARWDGVEVFADGDRTELVGFHESNSAEALPLDATRPIAKSHHAGVSVPTTGESDGQIIVLPTRQRASGAMTAMDLAVQAEEAVVSPVDGVVVDVSPIQYEGNDHKITIRPAGNQDVEITIIHINDPLVEAGDRVRGGESLVAATPRQLHFESQVDRFTEAARGAPTPHVHVEMRTAPQPLG